MDCKPVYIELSTNPEELPLLKSDQVWSQQKLGWSVGSFHIKSITSRRKGKREQKDICDYYALCSGIAETWAWEYFDSVLKDRQEQRFKKKSWVFKNTFWLLLQRGGRRRIERSISMKAKHGLCWGSRPQSNSVPWPGIELPTFGCTGQYPTNWATQGKNIILSFELGFTHAVLSISLELVGHRSVHH